MAKKASKKLITFHFYFNFPENSFKASSWDCKQNFWSEIFNFCWFPILDAILGQKMANFSRIVEKLILRTPKNLERMKNSKIHFRRFVWTPMNLLWMNFQEDWSENEKVISFLDVFLAIFHTNPCIFANFCKFRT